MSDSALYKSLYGGGLTQSAVDQSVQNKPESFVMRIGAIGEDLTDFQYDWFTMPYDFEVTDIIAHVATAGEGDDLVISVSAGETFITTDLTIDDGENSSLTAATPFSFDDDDVELLSEGDPIYIFVMADLSGFTTTVPQELCVTVIGHQR